jgi:hypothetical protein
MRSGPTKLPTVEVLEDRTLLSNTLLIDFSPGRLPDERQHLASFASGMKLTNANGRAYHFLDFDHDGKVNRADIGRMAQAIGQRVQTYFAGYDLHVVMGDVGKNSRLGLRMRLDSQDSPVPDHLYIIYVGGVSFDGTISTFGEAYQAPVGTNLEYYAFAFSESMIRWYGKNLPFAAPQQFANDLGTTVAHEFGHLLGLGHVAGNPPGDPNPMNYSSDPDTAYFPDATYPAIQLRDSNLNAYWGQQDPAAEIRASLAGQPAYNPSGLIYSITPGSTPKRLAARVASMEKTSALEIAWTRLHAHQHTHPAGHADWAKAVDAAFAAAA